MKTIKIYKAVLFFTASFCSVMTFDLYWNDAVHSQPINEDGYIIVLAVFFWAIYSLICDIDKDK